MDDTPAPTILESLTLEGDIEPEKMGELRDGGLLIIHKCADGRWVVSARAPVIESAIRNKMIEVSPKDRLNIASVEFLPAAELVSGKEKELELRSEIVCEGLRHVFGGLSETKGPLNSMFKGMTVEGYQFDPWPYQFVQVPSDRTERGRLAMWRQKIGYGIALRGDHLPKPGQEDETKLVFTSPVSCQRLEILHRAIVAQDHTTIPRFKNNVVKQQFAPTR